MIVEVEVAVCDVVQRDTDVVKTFAQFTEDVRKRVLPGDRMLCGCVVVGRSDAFVEFHIWTAAAAALFHALMKYAGDEERIVSDMCAEKERLGGRGLLQREQEVAHVLLRPFPSAAWGTHGFGAAKGFEQGSKVVAGVAIADVMLFEHVPEEDVKITLRGDVQWCAGFEHGMEQRIAVEDGITRLCIREELGERSGIAPAVSQRARDEVEVRSRQALPTIWSDHRRWCFSIADATRVLKETDAVNGIVVRDSPQFAR